MPRRADHLDQARGNREHARFLLRIRPTDPYALQWAVTAAFHCAVHCIEAHLAAAGQHPIDHADRERRMRDARSGVPVQVYRAYQGSKTRSQGGRYNLWRFTAEDVQHVVLDKYLASVTGFVGLQG